MGESCSHNLNISIIWDITNCRGLQAAHCPLLFIDRILQIHICISSTSFFFHNGLQHSFLYRTTNNTSQARYDVLMFCLNIPRNDVWLEQLRRPKPQDKQPTQVLSITSNPISQNRTRRQLHNHLHSCMCICSLKCSYPYEAQPVSIKVWGQKQTNHMLTSVNLFICYCVVCFLHESAFCLQGVKIV